MQSRPEKKRKIIGGPHDGQLTERTEPFLIEMIEPRYAVYRWENGAYRYVGSKLTSEIEAAGINLRKEK